MNIEILKNKLETYIDNNMIVLPNTQCWIPIVSTRMIRVKGKTVSLVRAMFLVYKENQLPEYPNPELGRTCKNSNCFNPEHLYYKTVWHRFWEKVDKKSDDECWEWKNAKDGGGYGVFFITHYPNTIEKAHRYSWFLYNGPIPDGMFVCHKCDNPSCVNPKHLFLGTNDDNILDKKNKNRCSRLFGASNGRNKLTENEVRKIMELHNNGISYRNLSKQFNIGTTQIARIIHKESWKWLWD